MNSSILIDNEIFLKEANSFLLSQKMKRENKDKIYKKLEDLAESIEKSEKSLDDMLRAATILGNVADENTKQMLNQITGVINSVLGLMFKEDRRRIYLKQEMWKNQYPHFKVELETEDGVKRAFTQSGTGLAQVISFLFAICLIDVRQGRKVMVMDEVLNGLHPDAKLTIKHLINDVLSEKFQFVIVEYGLDIGQQYEVVKKNSIASVTPYVGDEGYYKVLGYKDESESTESVIGGIG